MFKGQKIETGKLLIIAGSTCSGKSHLIAELKQGKYMNLLHQINK